MPFSSLRSEDPIATPQGEASRYCEETLGPAIGATNPRTVSQNERATVFFADSPSGPIVAKVYPGDRTEIARRSLAAQTALQNNDVPVPDLVWQDTNHTEPGRPACVVHRFVEGEQYRPGDRIRLIRAFENLATLHAIPAEAFRDPHPEAMPPRSLDHDWPLRESLPDEYDPAESLRNLFQRALGPFGRIDARRFAQWTAAAIEAVAKKRPPRVLLHGDYQKGNVIFDADCTPFTIDLDNVRTGGFGSELANALLRWRYGRTALIPYADLGGLGHDDVIAAAEAAYFSTASPESAEYWREHRETFLLAAYARSIRILIQRGCNAKRFGPLKRMRWSQVALVGWRRIGAHLKSDEVVTQISVPAHMPR
jgi:aminoglycoside phosphotransferase (APT) family kinase protein